MKLQNEINNVVAKAPSISNKVRDLKKEIKWLKEDKLPTLINGSDEAIKELNKLESLKAKLETLEEVKKEIEAEIEILKINIQDWKGINQDAKYYLNYELIKKFGKSLLGEK